MLRYEWRVEGMCEVREPHSPPRLSIDSSLSCFWPAVGGAQMPGER